MPIRVYYEVLNQKGTPAMYSDNYAQRPAAGYAGRIFFSPDTAQIFYDTGSTWTLLSDAGVGSGSLASVTANGNTTATGIVITANGLTTSSLRITDWAEGTIMFVTSGGTNVRGNPNLTWDNSLNYLGLGTISPSAPLDVHTNISVGIQINNLNGLDSKLAFLQAGVGKWRIGNLYNGGLNDFHVYNNTTSSIPFKIDGTNNIFINGTNTYISSQGNILSTSYGVTERTLGIYTTTGGYTTFNANVSGTTNYITFAYGTGNYGQFAFTNSANYTYTYPAVSGTIAVWSSATNGTLPKFGTNNLVNSMLSDDGTSVTSAGATRSNLYIKAVNNTYYGQLAFTNGSNGSYGGISYNNASQYMQFEANSSEYMRLYAGGNFRVFTSSATDNGNKFQVQGTASITETLYFGASNTGDIFVSPSNNNMYIEYPTGNDLVIRTQAGSERMRIQGNGLIFMNTTAGGATLNIKSQSGGNIIRFQNNASGDGTIFAYGTSTSLDYAFSTYSVSNAFYLYNNGNYSFAGSNVSDRRLKENIEIINYNATEKLMQLVPTSYVMISNPDIKRNGFIAQEVKNILPDFVTGNEDNDEYLGIDYNGLLSLNIKATQEINIRLTALEQNLN